MKCTYSAYLSPMEVVTYTHKYPPFLSLLSLLRGVWTMTFVVIA